MSKDLFNIEEHCVKKFHEWHRSFYKWMTSVSKSDLPRLETELDAIQQVKQNDVDNKYYIYKVELLDAQEAIVRRIIDEIKKHE